MTTTEAWVLYRASSQLRREKFEFPDITDDEVLVEPVYGCWEGNMAHALLRDPVDVCEQRGEEKIVIGNAGVVRVLKPGRNATHVRVGDLCLGYGSTMLDEHGYPRKIFAYDAPGTVGMLAKQIKFAAQQLIVIPPDTRYTMPQWAAFSCRYVTAWANWKVAYGCWQALDVAKTLPAPYVWGWGGGTAYAEVALARHFGCHAAMLTANERRMQMLSADGILAVDRRPFQNLSYDGERFADDQAFRVQYLTAEQQFLTTVSKLTEGHGISILVEMLGAPIFAASLNALGRPGVITTAGWKRGLQLSVNRASECIRQHIHVHTHYCRYHDVVEAMQFADQNGWMPTVEVDYDWDDIPQLADDYIHGRIDTYFPVYRVSGM